MVDARQQISELLPRLVNSQSEEEQDELFQRISILSPDPGWSDYVFHSKEYETETGELKIDEVVEKIMSYRAILL